MARGDSVFVALLFISVICRTSPNLLFSANPINVPENRPANQVIGTADDRNVEELETLYVLSGPPDEFQINAMSGVITSKKSFNYETDPRRYELVVECRDKDNVAVARAILVVNILNEEEAPDCWDAEFTKGTAVISIVENYPMLVPIYKVNATDQDIGDRLTFTLRSQTSARTPGGNFFSVDSTTGVVSRTPANPLDFEAGYNTFQLAIRATDITNRFCQGTVTININDTNDEPPVFQTFPRDTIAVSENTAVGTIIATIKATDRDARSTISYSFFSAQQNFAINSDTGDLTLVRNLDYDNPENPKVYPILIAAKDNDAVHTASYTLTVAVIDEDDPPVCDSGFTSGPSVFVSEKISAEEPVYRILARDPDEGEDVTFKVQAWSDDTDLYFNIDEESGLISTTDIRLDYEKDPKTFQMLVSVAENKDNPKSCTGTITLIIVNENDESPVFTNIPTNPITYRENLPAGTVLYELRATDRDIGDKVHYEFVNVYKGFAINEDSGDITLTFPPDIEDTRFPPIRTVQVRAYDNNRVHSVTAQLTFSLMDLNDNPPKCEDYLIVLQIPETTPVNTQLLQLKCWDDDILPPNNVLGYSMTLDKYSADKFTLTNNDISLGPHGLDYDNVTFAGMQFKHTLIVRVSDQGVPPLTSTVTIIVRVTPVNEFPPVTIQNVFSVEENSNIGTLVGTVTFTDKDWPFNNVKYTVVKDDFGIPPRFYIEPDTGNIKVLNSLDRETQAQYTASVRATDLNNDIEPDPLKQLTPIAVVTINIQNVNDEPPVCSPAHYYAKIYSTDKTAFLKLQCTDKDSPNNQLRYTIIGGNGLNRFSLLRPGNDPPSLTTRQNFQYNIFDGIQDPTVFQLLIEVTDEFGGNTAMQLTSTATVIVNVIPWVTTVPTTTTTTTTTSMTTSILVQYTYVWNPDNWFPTVIAIVVILFLLCLYALAWAFLKDVPKYARFFPQCHGCKKVPKPDSVQNTDTKVRNPETTDPKPTSNEKAKGTPRKTSPSTTFDGRAIDTATGKQYLFSSKTGEVQWLN